MKEALIIHEGNLMFYIGDDPEKSTAKITFRMEKEGVMTVDHTLVDEKHRGQGIALELVKRVIEHAREKQLKIIPECPYVKKVIDENISYQDIRVE